jgi:hypothetical protein
MNYSDYNTGDPRYYVNTDILIESYGIPNSVKNAFNYIKNCKGYINLNNFSIDSSVKYGNL